MLRVPKTTSNCVCNDQYGYASNTEKCLFNTSKPPSVVGTKGKGKRMIFFFYIQEDHDYILSFSFENHNKGRGILFHL